MSGSAVILDTETTGFDEPQVIQLAFMGPVATPFVDDAIQKLTFRPTKPIELGALATHHILDEDLADSPVWPGGWALPPGTDYLVGHAIDFDWEAIGKPDVKRICTLALARRHFPDLDSHKLGALTYHLSDRREARELLRNAHDAATDVELCCRLLTHLVVNNGIETWEQLYAASEIARVPIHMGFGKYGPDEDWAKANGGPMRCADVRSRDNSYYWWLMNKCDQVRKDPYLRKALIGESA